MDDHDDHDHEHGEFGSIIPTLRYRDPLKAIDWLTSAFGFRKHVVIPGDNGGVMHAELWHGTGMVMIGTDREDKFNFRSPGPGGMVTAWLYVVVEDIDAHHDKAKAAGAEIVIPLGDTSYGSREYAARDPEGVLWSFGTYRPN